MKPVKLIASVSTIAILGLLAANVGAQQTNVQERTFLTFSSPVEMPGVVLEPGTYEFRLADTPRRNVVQVYRKDGADIVGQWTFVESQRQRVSDETVVMFRETAEGTTPAVQYWYYPGERIGKEFIYPKDQAERIAARTGQPVRTDDGVAEAAAAADVNDSQQPARTSAAASSAPEASDVQARADANANRDAIDTDARDSRADADRVEAQPQASAAPQQPSAAAQPSAPAGSTTGNRGVSAQAEAGTPEAESSVRADASVSAEQPRAAQAESAPADSQVAVRQQPAEPARPVGTTGSSQQQADGEFRTASELPRTASPLALAGLLGLLSLAGAAGLRRFRR